MENKRLLAELSPGDELTYKESLSLYQEAERIEFFFRKSGAVSGKDYTLIDLFKLAVENLKATQLENIGNQLNKIEYQLYDRNDFDKKRR